MSTPENGNQLPPVPRYGEYAPPSHVPAAPPYAGPPPVAPPPQYTPQPYFVGQNGTPPLRISDVIVSVLLLAFGLFGALTGINAAFQLEYVMQVEYTQFDLGTYVQNGPFVAVQAVIIVSHAVLFVISLPVTIALLKKRAIAFWVPLTAGVLAAVIFWVALFALIFADPALSEVLLNPPR